MDAECIVFRQSFIYRLHAFVIKQQGMQNHGCLHQMRSRMNSNQITNLRNFN